MVYVVHYVEYLQHLNSCPDEFDYFQVRCIHPPLLANYDSCNNVTEANISLDQQGNWKCEVMNIFGLIDKKASLHHLKEKMR